MEKYKFTKRVYTVYRYLSTLYKVFLAYTAPHALNS